MPVEPQPSSASRLLNADAQPHLTARALLGARHAFFGREGGVSTGIYSSLNAGTGSRDAHDAVAENRRSIAAAFNLPPQQLVGVHQVHSPVAHAITAPWPGARPEGDALVTATPGLALAILTADCAPVLFADVEARVIGAAHAGWKGAFGDGSWGVLEATVARMKELGATRIAAAIGPCIAQANYEVGPEFEARFRDADATNARFFRPGIGDRLLFDLSSYCAARLERLGIAAEQTGADTFTASELFFSHRRSLRENAGDYGRNCSVIALS